MSLNIAMLLRGQADMTVRDWRSKLDYNNLPRSKTWGVQINDQMMEVDARVLPPPVVLYGGNQRTQPRNG